MEPLNIYISLELEKLPITSQARRLQKIISHPDIKSPTFKNILENNGIRIIPYLQAFADPSAVKLACLDLREGDILFEFPRPTIPILLVNNYTPSNPGDTNAPDCLFLHKKNLGYLDCGHRNPQQCDFYKKKINPNRPIKYGERWEDCHFPNIDAGDPSKISHSALTIHRYLRGAYSSQFPILRPIEALLFLLTYKSMQDYHLSCEVRNRALHDATSAQGAN